MNSALADRHLRALNDSRERRNEWKIQRIQASYGLDRTTAAQTLEWIELKVANTLFASSIGFAAAYYVQKRFVPTFRERMLIFRKPWIAPIAPLFAFYCGYLGGSQLRGRRFQGSLVNFEKLTGENDIVSRFRNMDVESEKKTPTEQIADYLNTTTAISRTQLEGDIVKLVNKNHDAYKNKKIKRLDKDTNKIFWELGKIHGIENIAFVDEEELKRTEGNPVKIQQLVANAKPPGPPAQSFDGLISHAMEGMALYKDQINKMTLNRSDRSKLLALPFFMHRRAQSPAPRKGQWQYDLFTELAGGRDWHYYDKLQFDTEKKITIYNYEKHLPASYLENCDTSSPEFKKEIKMMTLLQKTQYEQHKELKETFRKLMNVFAFMNEEEGRAYIHLINNKGRNNYLEDIHGGKLEEMLAKLSEEEGYVAKNDYYLRKTRLDYMKKDDYPIEKTKVKDLFKHAKEFKLRFSEELGIYDTLPRMYDEDKRKVQEFIRSATGPFLALRNEIGLDMTGRLSTSFLRAKDFKEVKEYWCEDPILDHSFYYMMNQTYLNVNMTEYEEVFVGPGELKRDSYVDEKTAHLARTMNTQDFYNNPERNVLADASETLADWEPKLNFWRNTWEEENLAPEEEDDDDEGEGEEDEIEPYAPAYIEDPEFDEDEYEPVDWEPGLIKGPIQSGPSTFFDSKLEERYEDVELDSFMKFLDVKPFLSWRDRAGYHNRLGMHMTEDFAQRVDPDFHILAEVEREQLEKIIFKKHRTGSTVRFVIDGSKPNFGRTLD